MVRHSSVPLGVALVLLGCYAGNLVVAQKGAQHPQPSFPAYPPPQDPQPPKAPSWPAYPPPQDPQPPKAPTWPARPPPQDPQPPKAPSWPAYPPPQHQQPPKAPEHPPPQYQQPQQAPQQYQQPPKAPAHPPPQYQQPPKAPANPPPQYQQPQQAPQQYQQPPKAPAHLPPQYQQPPKAPADPPPQYQQPQQAPQQYQQPPKAPAHLPPQYQQPPKAPAHPPPQYQQPPKAPAHPPPQYQQPPKTPAHPPPQYQQPQQAPEHPPPQYQQPPKAPEHPPPQYQQPPKAPEHPKQPSWPAQRPPTKPSQVQFDAAGKGQDLQNPGQEMSLNPQSCVVDIPLRIPCGGPDISPAACMAIHCCSDINGCYYGKAVTVQCTKDASFIVVAARDATLPNIDLESISLMSSEPGCTHVDFNSLFAIYHFPVTSCGSIVMEHQGSIIYENKLVSTYEVGVGPFGSVTRDSYYEVRFRCIYRGVSVETLMTETIKPAGPVAIAPVIGPIRVELRLGNGVCTTKGCDPVGFAYDSYYVDSDYPVNTVLRDPVYIEVRLLNMNDPRLILTLGRCWTTIQPNPHSMPQWDILIEGCPNQSDLYLSTLVPIGPSSGLPFPSHYKRFIFQMFTFVDQDMSPLREQVYIHCSSEVCTPGQGEQCDPSCGGRNKRDVAATKVAKEPRMVMTVGPLLVGRVEEAHQVP